MRSLSFTPMHKAMEAVRAFGADVAGATAVVFALMAAPATAMIGMAMDLVAV